MTHEDPLNLRALFDQAVTQPSRRDDAVGAMFSGLAAAMQAASDEKRARQKARREARANRPEAIAARKAAARRGWETRRRNAEEKAAEAERELDEWAGRTSLGCNALTHDSRGSETFCLLEPGHEDDNHDNGEFTWPRDENEGETTR